MAQLLQRKKLSTPRLVAVNDAEEFCILEFLAILLSFKYLIL